MDALWLLTQLFVIPAALVWGTLLVRRRWSPRTVTCLPLRMIHAGVVFDIGLSTQAYLATLHEVRERWAGNQMNIDAAWGNLGIQVVFMHWISFFVALGVTLVLGLLRIGEKSARIDRDHG